MCMQLVQRPEEYDMLVLPNRLEYAISAIVAERKSATYDTKPSRDDPTAVGTSEVADAIAKLEAEVPA